MPHHSHLSNKEAHNTIAFFFSSNENKPIFKIKKIMPFFFFKNMLNFKTIKISYFSTKTNRKIVSPYFNMLFVSKNGINRETLKIANKIFPRSCTSICTYNEAYMGNKTFPRTNTREKFFSR